MISVDLQTSAREFVATVRVAPFKEPPEVIIWGVRVFVRVPKRWNASARELYREVFAVVVP